ncbi:MAG: hypothetical protein CMF29_00320 [Kiritimatiellaceae bacterium]|nr:hypothetical protein [Kiritimatiellaceae bacterium]
MALPSQDIQALANAAEERKRREQEAAELAVKGGATTLAGLAIGKVGFEQATGRTATPIPAGPPSELSRQVAANDAANRAAAAKRAADSRFIIQGGGNPTGSLNPALGPQGGSTLPPQPPLSSSSSAASNSAAGIRNVSSGAGTAYEQSGRLRDVRLRDVADANRRILATQTNNLINNPVTRNAFRFLGNLPRGSMVEAGFEGAADLYNRTERRFGFGNYSDEAVAEREADRQEFLAEQAALAERRLDPDYEPQVSISDLYEVVDEPPETPEQRNQRILGERRERLEELERRTERMRPNGFLGLNSFALPDDQYAAKMTDSIDQFLGNLARRENVFIAEPDEKSARDLLAEREEILQAATEAFEKGEARVKEGKPFKEGTFEEYVEPPVVYEQNPNRGSGGSKVPQSELRENNPVLTGLDLYNQQYERTMQQQGGEMTPDQIKAAKVRGAQDGFGFDPKNGFFEQDFEGQDFEGQSIGEYLSVEFKPREGATIAGTGRQLRNVQTAEFRDSNQNGIEDRSEGIYKDSDYVDTSFQDLVKTLDPNTGEMIMADQETANDIADFYARQRRGEALTRQEALESDAMKDFSNRQLRNVIDSEYSRESRAREDRIANRPDFNATFSSGADVGPRTYGGYTTGELRKLVGRGDALEKAKVLADNGKDPLTGKDIDTGEMSEYQRGVLNLENKKFEQSQIDSAKPETMTPYQSEMVDLANKKYEDVKAEAARLEEIAKAEGATKAQKDELDIAQRRVNLSQSYLDLVRDSEEVPEELDLNFEKFESKLDVLEDTMDIEFDHRTQTFYKGNKRSTILPNSKEGRTMSADPFFKLIFDQYPVKK